MSIIYPGGDEQVTPNLGLATWGMDEVLAENMILIDAAIGGPTGSIKINGSVVPATNFINSASVTFTVVGSNVSATATGSGSAAWSSLTGALSNGQVIPYADAGISRLGAASLAIGNGTAGDFSGTLVATFLKAGNSTGATSGAIYMYDSSGVISGVDYVFGGVARRAVGSGGSFVWSGTTNASQAVDSGISRLGAASLAIGNGTAGDFSGSLKVTTINLGSNCLLQEIPAGVTAGGLYLTSTAKYTTNPSGNPNVWIPLWTNAGATAGVANDSYLVLQAGNLAAHARCYIDFVDYDGSNKWLIGKNGQAGTTPNQFILYDAVADIHRIVGNSALDGSGGNTYLAAAGANAVIINGNDGISDTSCTGGFQVWGGGSGGTGAVKRFVVLDNGNVGIGNNPSSLLDVGVSGAGASGQFQVSTTAITASLVPFVADNTAGYQWAGSGNTNIHFGTTNNTIILTSSGSSPSHDIAGINTAHGLMVNGNVYLGFTPTSDVTAAPDVAFSRLAAGSMLLGNPGTACQLTMGNLSLNRINKAGADFAGQATVTAGNTTQAVTFAANYTGTGQPVIVLTPTSDPLAAGLPVGYWVTYSGGAGAWSGFTVNIQTALAGDVTFNYIVVGVA